jgi:uncharacterized protein YqgC (DUF456 family)
LAVALIVIGFVLMLAGLAGTFVPGLPDTILALAGGVLVLLANGFTARDALILVLLLIIAAIAEVMTYFGQALGAKRAGASTLGVVGALLGGVVGIFVFPPWGLLVGPLLGAILGELIAGKQAKSAMKAGIGAVLGVLTGVVLKLSAVVAMIGLAVLSLIL